MSDIYVALVNDYVYLLHNKVDTKTDFLKIFLSNFEHSASSIGPKNEIYCKVLSSIHRKIVTALIMLHLIYLKINKKEDFREENLAQYTLWSLGGNHLTHAMQDLANEGISNYRYMFVAITYTLVNIYNGIIFPLFNCAKRTPLIGP